MPFARLRERGIALWLVLGLVVALAIVAGVVVLFSTYLTWKKDPPPVDYNRKLYEYGLKCAGIEKEEDNQWDEYVLLVMDADEAMRGVPGMVRAGDSSLKDPFFSAQPTPGSDDTTDYDPILAQRAIDALSSNGILDRVEAWTVNAHKATPTLIEGPIVDWNPEDYRHFKDLTRALTWKLVRAIDQRDQATARRTLRQVVALINATYARPGTLARFRANRALSLLCEQLRVRLADHRIDADAGSVLELMRAVPLPTLEQALEGDRLLALDAISRYLPTGSLVRERNRSEQSARANAIYDQCIALLTLPRVQDRLVAADAIVEREKGLGGFATSFVPDLEKLIVGDAKTRLSLSSVRVMAALLVHKSRQGDLPETLDQIDKDLIVEIPIDPYSGNRLCYHKIDPATDEFHRPYLLYSTGADGVDDGGKVGAKPFDAFLRNNAGIDFVLNRPDE